MQCLGHSFGVLGVVAPVNLSTMLALMSLLRTGLVGDHPCLFACCTCVKALWAWAYCLVKHVLYLLLSQGAGLTGCSALRVCLYCLMQGHTVSLNRSLLAALAGGWSTGALAFRAGLYCLLQGHTVSVKPTCLFVRIGRVSAGLCGRDLCGLLVR